MSLERRQTWLLLKTALRMDFLPRAGAESRLRRARPFVFILLMYGLLGSALGFVLARAEIPLLQQVTMLYLVAAMLIFLNLMVEYQEILFSPVDSDVLGWRPIPSRTLFVARVLHVLVYVTILTSVNLAVPCIVLGLEGPQGGPAVAVAFAVGALLNALFATAVIVLLSGLLLRRLSPERFQDVLGWVQLGFMVTMVFGYQLLTPRVVGTAFGERSPVGRWLALSPPGWYASLPVLASGTSGWQVAFTLGLGVLVLLAAGGFALRRLAPDYAFRVERVRVAAGVSPALPARRSPFVRLFGSWLAREPLRLLGFDFLLAQLRGDRRIRVQLMPLVAFPVALTLAGLVLSHGADPYVPHEVVRGAQDLQGRGQPHFDRMEEGTPPFDDVEETHRGVVILFTGLYMMTALAVTLGHGLGRSPDWRAAWIFHAAPLERYDAFYAGLMWGVVYALLLPAVALVGLTLLVAWRQPLHVAAHVILPAGLAVLGFPLGAALHLEPPFTREPQRHARGMQVGMSFLVTLPLLGIAILHYSMRGRTLLLVAAGLLCAGLGTLAWRLEARHLRNVFRRTAFDG